MQTADGCGRSSVAQSPERARGSPTRTREAVVDLRRDTASNDREDHHGFWLDAGEEGRVRDIIAERVRGPRWAARAHSSWGGFLNGLGGRGSGGGSIWDRLFGGR